MDEQKRFYWLKLKDDFFQDEAIEWLEEQENGSLYTLFYLKLCLKSLKTDGILIRTVGEMLVPYNVERLSSMTKTPIDTVVVALELLKKIGLVKVVEDGAMFIPQIAEMTGSESANDNAQRQKRWRERQKIKKIAQNTENLLPSVTNSNAVSNVSNVTDSNTVTLRNRNESIEYRDKSKENRDKEKINKKKAPKRNAYGEYKNVYLSDEELLKFQTEFADADRFIEEMSGWLAENGKTKKDYLAALRNWAKRDYGGRRYPSANKVDTDSFADIVI